MSSRKEGVILGYVSLFIKNSTSLLLIPLMLRVLGQSEYGLYILVNSIFAYFLLLDFGITNSVVRYVSEFRAKNDKKSESNFLAIVMFFYSSVSLIAILGGIILRNILPNIFQNSLTSNEVILAKAMFVVLIINIALTLFFNVFNGVLRAYEEFAFSKLINISKLVIRFFLLIYLLSKGYKAYTIIVADTILNALFGLIYATYVVTRLKVRPRFYKLQKAFAKEVLSYSIFIFISMLAVQLYWMVDNVILGVLTSTAIVAVYSIGTTINSYFESFGGTISEVVMPGVVKMVVSGASNEELTDEMVRIGRIKLLLMGLVLIGFIFLGQKFIVLWAGQTYIMAYYVACLVIFPQIISYTQNVAVYVMWAKNKHKLHAVLMLIIALLNCAITIILVKRIGMIGAAVGTAFVFVFGYLVIFNLYYRKVLGLNIIRFYKELFKGILPALIGMSIICFGIIQLSRVSWNILFIQIGLTSLAYGIIMWCFAMNSSEKAMVTISAKKIGRFLRAV